MGKANNKRIKERYRYDMKDGKKDERYETRTNELESYELAHKMIFFSNRNQYFPIPVLT